MCGWGWQGRRRERKNEDIKRKGNRKKACTLNKSPIEKPDFLSGCGSTSHGCQTLCDTHCVLVKKLQNSSEYSYLFPCDCLSCVFMTQTIFSHVYPVFFFFSQRLPFFCSTVDTVFPSPNAYNPYLTVTGRSIWAGHKATSKNRSLLILDVHNVLILERKARAGQSRVSNSLGFCQTTVSLADWITLGNLLIHT